MSEKEFINKLKELNSPAALWYCFANVYKAYQTEPNELFKAIDDAKIYQDTLNEILCEHTLQEIANVDINTLLEYSKTLTELEELQAKYNELKSDYDELVYEFDESCEDFPDDFLLSDTVS